MATINNEQFKQLSTVVIDSTTHQHKELDIYPVSCTQASYDGVTGDVLSDILKNKCIYYVSCYSVNGTSNFNSAIDTIPQSYRQPGMVVVFNCSEDNSIHIFTFKSTTMDNWTYNSYWKEIITTDNISNYLPTDTNTDLTNRVSTLETKVRTLRTDTDTALILSQFDNVLYCKNVSGNAKFILSDGGTEVAKTSTISNSFLYSFLLSIYNANKSIVYKEAAYVNESDAEPATVWVVPAKYIYNVSSRSFTIYIDDDNTFTVTP